MKFIIVEMECLIFLVFLVNESLKYHSDWFIFLPNDPLFKDYLRVSIRFLTSFIDKHTILWVPIS